LIIPGLSFFLNFGAPALQCLINRAFTLHELPSLIKAVLLNTDADGMIRRFCVDDAQVFIDVIYEVRPIAKSGRLK